MKIILTRHGQTSWNVLGKVQGVTDIELNDTGIKQAEETREKLLNYNIDYIITSPLKRAKKTAEIIGKDRNIPILVDEGLKERAYGEIEGKTQKEFDINEVWSYKPNKQFKDMESVGQLFDRINIFLDNLKQNYPDKTVLIVTHGGICVPIISILEENQKLLNLGMKNCELKEYEL